MSNPVFAHVSGADYAPGPFDQAAASFAPGDLMPLERTYSEWKHSAFPAGVYAPDFAGNKPGGMVASCQDCHMRDVQGKGCNDPAASERADLPLHDMMGGNAWLPSVIASLYPTETDAAALAAGAARAVSMLQKAATLAISVEAGGPGYLATVTVTNRSGHKLPTGYPEGRRMWLHVVARDDQERVVYESGAYDAATGVLAASPPPIVYDAHLGIPPALAGALSLPAGVSFHFALNDTIYKDNRIPPQGFTNAAFAGFGGVPVDPEWPGPGPRYADGQNWDAAIFPLPATARSLAATLYYQTTSKDYVEFLRDGVPSLAAGVLLVCPACGQPAHQQVDAKQQEHRRGVDDADLVALLGREPFGDRGRDQVQLRGDAGDQHLAFALAAARPHLQPLAEGDELGVFLHVGDEVEHLVRRMRHDVARLEMRHRLGRRQAACAARAARKRAKSSPAWWEERVSGLAETKRKPLA